MRQEAREAKHHAILAAAGKLLTRRRFADVSLDDVAAEANVAKGTLYLYFDSKDALYLAYMAQMTTPLLTRLQQQIPEAARTSSFAAIELMIREILEFSRRNPALQDVIHATTRASQEAANSKLKRELRALLVDTLRDGIDRGELRDLSPELSAEVILGVFPRLIQKCSGKPRAGIVRETIEHLTEIFGHGLLQPSTKSRRSTPTSAETP